MNQNGKIRSKTLIFILTSLIVVAGLVFYFIVVARSSDNAPASVKVESSLVKE